MRRRFMNINGNFARKWETNRGEANMKDNSRKNFNQTLHGYLRAFFNGLQRNVIARPKLHVIMLFWYIFVIKYRRALGNLLLRV